MTLSARFVLVVYVLVFFNVALGATYSVEAYKDACGYNSTFGNVGQHSEHIGRFNGGILLHPLGWAAYALPGDFDGSIVNGA